MLIPLRFAGELLTNLTISFAELQKAAWTRYVGPFNKAAGPSGISFITKYLLANFTGIALNVSICESGAMNVSCTGHAYPNINQDL